MEKKEREREKERKKERKKERETERHGESKGERERETVGKGIWKERTADMYLENVCSKESWRHHHISL